MGNHNSNSPFIEEDKEGTLIKPSNFSDLLSRIEILSQFESNRLFYREINISNELSYKISKYIRLKGIKRFCIPIMGVISSGKSTFMNYLLQLNNVLEVGDLVCTQFICIIRHDEKATIPEIKEVSIEKRYDEAFNFVEKGANLLNCNEGDSSKILKEKIKKRNDEISKTKKNEDEKSERYLDPEDYFLIIKTKIPLFEGEYKDYGELIDFLDIPGLDENGDSNFNNFIKPIFKNILFPIFIADFQNYTHDGPKEIIKQFWEYYCEITKINILENNKFNIGFYILNKIDLYIPNNNDTKEDIIKDFIKIYSSIETNSGNQIINNIKENDNFIEISARELCKGNQNSKIDEVIKEIIQESKNSHYNSFKRLIKNFLKKQYNIDLNKANEEIENKNLEEKRSLNNKLLNDNCQGFNDEPKLNLKEFTYIYNNISNKLLPKPDERVKELIQKKIKNMLDDILTFKLEGLLKTIISKEQKDKMKEANNTIKEKTALYNKNFIYFFNRQVKYLFGEPNEPNNSKMRSISPLTNVISDLFNLNSEYKKINDIIKKISDFEDFYKKKKIRILFLGKISSGKTSLMNSIIGYNYNILPITSKENTNNIFILKYSSSTIKLSESKLIENENGNFFEEGETIIELNDSQIKNKNEIDQIRNKIKDINDKNKFKYFSLYIPIEALEKIKNNQNIELIDMPGIKESLIAIQSTNKNDGFDKIELQNLINLTDGFIFSFNAINIKDNASQKLLTDIINYIKIRKDSFSFENCLFNLNCIDQFNQNQIEDKKKIFEEEIKKSLNVKLYNGNFIERIEMRNNINSIKYNISYISNTRYSIYQEKIHQIESLEFINQEDNLKSLNDIDEYLNDEYPNLINQTYNKKDKDKFNEIIDKLKQLIPENYDVLYKKIANHIISILNNKKELNLYKNSYAQIFFNAFYKQIESSKINNEKLMESKVVTYSFRLLYYLFYIDSLCLDITKINQLNFKIKEKKKILENKYKDYEKKVNSYFKIIFDKIKQIQSDITKKIGGSKFISTKSRTEIKLFIKKEKVTDKIYELVNQLSKQLDSLKNEFLNENLVIISDILDNSEKFENLFSGLLSKFQVGSYYKTTTKKYSLAGILFSIGLAISFIPIPLIDVVGGVISGIGEILFFYHSDSLVIDDYFNDIRKSIENYENLYKNEINNIKDKFKEELDGLGAYSKKEIEYLKKRNFHTKFNQLIENIDNYNDYSNEKCLIF